MPFRFRPRVGPFVYVPPRRPARPPATSQADQNVQVALILGSMVLLGAAILGRSRRGAGVHLRGISDRRRVFVCYSRGMNDAKPLILDLFCKAGGAGRGYSDAGFEVIGVDIEPQPRYPFRFVQRSAFDALADPDFLAPFAAIHASPVCKVHTALKAFSASHHENQIPLARELLDASGLPYVIENVPGAPLTDPIALCGSMFGLGVRRHRLFELGRWKAEQPACDHPGQDSASPLYPVKRYHSGRPEITMSPVIGVYGRGQGLGPGEVDLWRKAMGIDWMIRDELSQAIPPAYTRWVGQRLLAHLRGLL